MNKVEFLSELGDQCLTRFGMNQEDFDSYNKKVREINSLTIKEWDTLMRKGECPYPVEHLKGVPVGMHHCGLCGTMVIAGMPHGPMDPPWDPEISVMCSLTYEQFPELRTP